MCVWGSGAPFLFAGSWCVCFFSILAYFYLSTFGGNFTSEFGQLFRKSSIYICISSKILRSHAAVCLRE